MTYWVTGEDKSFMANMQEPFLHQCANINKSSPSIISNSPRNSPVHHAVRFQGDESPTPSFPNGDVCQESTSSSSLNNSPSCPVFASECPADNRKRHSLPPIRTSPMQKSSSGLYSLLTVSPVRVKVKQIGDKFVTTKLKINSAPVDGVTSASEKCCGHTLPDELCQKGSDGESVV